MSEIKMRYVFEKKINDDSDLSGLIRQILKDASSDMVDDRLFIDLSEVFYSLKRGSSFSRYRLELVSKSRLNIAISDLIKLDKAIMTTPEQKYFTVTRYYDGVSESFCERLYPKFAKYERGLRQLIILVLSKAMGPNWPEQTLSKEQIDNLKGISKGKFRTHDVIENMTLYELEGYLFNRKSYSYEEIVESQFNSSTLKEQDKDALLSLIEQMKPKSLWERNFSSIGRQEDWEKSLKEVQDVRNKVAHHKTITEKEYKSTLRALNELSRKIDNTVEQIEDAEFSNITVADVMAGFSGIAETMANVLKQYDFSEVFRSIQNVTASIQPIVDSIRNLYSNGLYERIQANMQATISGLQDSIRPILEMQQQINTAGLISALEPLCIEQYEPEIKTVIGVDGCKSGWLVAACTDNRISLSKFCSIKEIIDNVQFEVCLIDMIIGLQSKVTNIRPEAEARKELKNRASTMFPAPSRQAVYGSTKEERLAANVKALGKKYTSQTDAIIPKIRELDEYMQSEPDMRDKILESHPEVCFSRLNGEVIQNSKHTEDGIKDRAMILQRYLPEVSYEWVRDQAKIMKCAEDDIVDAICLAIVAGMQTQGETETIPKEPMADETGLLMKLTVPEYR